MIELDKRVWDDFVSSFTGRLSVNYTIEDALKMFVEDYWTVLDTMANQACEKEEVKESTEEYATKTYLREKNQIIWDYVYNLNREIGNLKKDVALLKESNAAKTIPYGPIKNPNNIPPTHGYSLDQYMVTANGNVPISGKVNDAQYTQEQIDEWSKIRYTPLVTEYKND